MKKALLLSFAIICFSQTFAQVKIGLRVAPSLSINRVNDKDATDLFTFDRNGAGIGFTAGPIVDFYLSDNYAITTGIWYSSKRAGYEVSSLGGKFERVVGLQYVQLPVLFKLFTNEIATDMKLYFSVGATVDVKIAEKLRKQNPALVGNYENSFQPLDLGVYAGAGVEMQLGTNTSAFGGIFYNRGLLNQAKNRDNFKFKDAVDYGVDLLGLEVGLKF
ncbi:MAG TPA: porin family protein [Cytophagaceae bacterium]